MKPSSEEAEYWNRVLATHGLSVDRGLEGGRLIYAGTGRQLEIIRAGIDGDVGCGGGRRNRPKPNLSEIDNKCR